MRRKNFILVILVASIVLIITLFSLKQYLLNWGNDKMAQMLYIVVDDRFSGKVIIYHQCFLGKRINFKSGIGFIELNDNENELRISQNISEVSIRVLDKSLKNRKIPPSIFTEENPRIVSIKDSILENNTCQKRLVIDLKNRLIKPKGDSH